MVSKTFVFFLAAAGISAAGVAQQKVVVPAFFGLSTSTDPPRGTDWRRIRAAGSSVQTVVALGGQGGFQSATGTGLSDAQAQFNNNRSAGQSVLGYVDTNPCLNSGCSPRSQPSVLQDSAAWFNSFPTPAAPPGSTPSPALLLSAG